MEPLATRVLDKDIGISTQLFDCVHDSSCKDLRFKVNQNGRSSGYSHRYDVWQKSQLVQRKQSPMAWADMVTNKYELQTMVIIKTSDVLSLMDAIKPTSSWNIDKTHNTVSIYPIRVKWS